MDLLNLKSSSTISCLGFMLYLSLVLFAEFLDAALAHNTDQFNKVSVLSIQFPDFLNLKSCYTISYLGFMLFFTSLWFYLLNLWMLHLHTIQLNSIKSLLSAQCIVLFWTIYLFLQYSFLDPFYRHNLLSFLFFMLVSPPSRRSKVVTRINAYLAPPFLPIAPMHIF